MGRVAGKVALITGAARGQGRSHAVRFAEEGADIIALDACVDISTNGYPLAAEEDLAETVKLVEKFGQRIVAREADVRERAQLQQAVKEGVDELGRLDIVVAQAGIAPMGPTSPPAAFTDVVDVKLAGITNTVSVALPHLGAGSSIICTGSSGAYVGAGGVNPAVSEGGGMGGAGYTFAAQATAKFVHDLALALGPHDIRVNGVHPGNVNTDMLSGVSNIMRPDLENPTQEDCKVAYRAIHLMPHDWLESRDVSHTVLFLGSDESRFVTGMQMHVDCGVFVKNNPFTL